MFYDHPERRREPDLNFFLSLIEEEIDDDSYHGRYKKWKSLDDLHHTTFEFERAVMKLKGSRRMARFFRGMRLWLWLNNDQFSWREAACLAKENVGFLLHRMDWWRRLSWWWACAPRASNKRYGVRHEHA